MAFHNTQEASSKIGSNIRKIFLDHNSILLRESAADAAKCQEMRKRRKIATVHSLRVAFYRTKIPKAMCFYVAQYLRVAFPQIRENRENALKVITSYSLPPSANRYLPGCCEWNIFDQYTHVESHGWMNRDREALLNIVYPTVNERVENQFVPGMRQYLENMTVTELRKKCREKHVKSSGTKAKLVQNLLYQSLSANSEIALY